MATKAPCRVAVIGCGWWAQGWHLPHLLANEDVEIVGVVDSSPLPKSTLSSAPLLSLPELSKKYKCRYYSSVEDMLADSDVGPALDGAIVATSHASHFRVGMALLREGLRRRDERKRESNCTVVAENKSSRPHRFHRPLHILMEKPMTCSVDEALELYNMSMKYPESAFVINHTASYRPQTFVAKEIISSGQLGDIRHITATMNGGLMWLFDDEKNESWVSKTPWQNGENKTPMNGNGYAWGQLAHILAWIYAVLGEDVAVPTKVFCNMTHSIKTGADISLAAVITCKDGITFSIAGTALLPGSQYADPPVGKRINVEIFGTNGCLLWGGDDRIPESGRLEVRRSLPGKKEDGQSHFPCSREKIGNELNDGFYFEDGNQDGKGPGSMNVFLEACKSALRKKEGNQLADEVELAPVPNDSLIGLRTVQIIDAMYQSAISGDAVTV